MGKPNKYSYHVTTYEAAKGIIDDNCVDPNKSQGKQNVAWYVNRNKITWAIAHVCQRHDCKIEDVAIITVQTPTGGMMKGSKVGTFCTHLKLHPVEMVSASMWLQREERRVFIPGSNGRITRRDRYE